MCEQKKAGKMALAASMAVMARKCLRDENLGINPFRTIANHTQKRKRS
ncbi:hypothetical protein [Campylobacter concisus]